MERPPIDMARQAPDAIQSEPLSSVEATFTSGIAYPQVLNPSSNGQPIHRSESYTMSSSRYSSPPGPSVQARRATVASNPTPPSISSQFYPSHLQGYRQYYNGQLSQQNPYISSPARYEQHPFAHHGVPDAPPPPLPPKPPSMPIEYPTISRAATIANPYLRTQVADGCPPCLTSYYEPHQSTPSAARNEPPPPPLNISTPAPPAPSVPSIAEESPVVSPTDESNDLALALAISQSESNDQRRLQEQEEEDLARALAESLLSTGSNIDPHTDPFFANAGLSSSHEQPSSTAASSGLASTPINGHSASTPIHVAVEPAQESSATPTYPQSTHSQGWRTPASHDHQSSDDLYVNGSSAAPSPFSSPSVPVPSCLGVPSPEIPPKPHKSRPPSPEEESMLAYLDESSPPDHEHESHSTSDTDDAERTTTLASHIPQSLSPPYASQTLPNQEMVALYAEQTTMVFDDEAYARQLAAEEEEYARQEEERQRLAGEKGRPMSSYEEEEVDSPPMYQPDWQPEASGSSTSMLSRVESASSTSSTSFSSVPFASTVPHKTSSWQPPSDSHTVDFRHISSLTSPTSPSSYSNGPSSYHPTAPSPYSSPPLTRRQSDTDRTSLNSHHSSTYSTASAPPPVVHSDKSPTFPEAHRASVPSSASSSPQINTVVRPVGAAAPQTPQQSMPMPMPTPTSASSGMLNINHFLDAELLNGVSIGFTNPTVSPKLQPMRETFPTLISMPYSRCPPLHLQAPDWRHLLRLMARLSQTKIQATVEAMAAAQGDLKLRIVVQFIKPNPQAKEWRTILWFSIDHPVPPKAPGASRYLSGNTNLLPWSYTQSPVPIPLRSNADTNISKTYTIPATDKVPLPTLPITFPDLAMYLHAALDNSRQHPNDTVHGVGKLGKLVQMYYPARVDEIEPEFGDSEDRSRMRDRLKRVIGRGKKDNKGKSTNNDRYQLVTPFISPEWG